ncbi:MAG: tRNA pseudouridine(55) synthase TruB [Gemmatimonadota bacterium]|nr:tRNA pseudouridine(55) synthase TruB [Gemmatimonadota bacterium]
MSLGPAGAVLPVDKPVGPTSHDMVAVVRRALGIRKVGHTGTLDPFASGLLLVCLGRATRIAEYLTGLDKEYVATAELGVATTTDDAEGDVVEEHRGWAALDPSRIARELATFVGTLEQVPPQYSAKKVRGEAMYRRARRGEQVELQPNRVNIRDAELLWVDLPRVRFRIRCSSGTYVRAVARDLGNALGVGGHLTELRRTSVGGFGVGEAVHPDALADLDSVSSSLLDPLGALAHMPTWAVEDEIAGRLRHGQRVRYSGPPAAGPLTVASGRELVAVGHVSEGVFKPSKVFS